MPKLWVHDGTAWQQVKKLHVKNSANVWTPVRQGFVNDSGVNRLFYPDYQGNITYAVPGTFYYTVPNGITSLQFIVAGAGGGGGGNDSPGVGHPGYAGIRIADRPYPRRSAVIRILSDRRAIFVIFGPLVVHAGKLDLQSRISGCFVS